MGPVIKAILVQVASEVARQSAPVVAEQVRRAEQVAQNSAKRWLERLTIFK